MELDDWQKKVLETKGNICLRSGRQVGKTTIISVKAAQYAVQNPKKTILIIASVERQALHLFEKTLGYIHDNHKILIKKGKDKPTKHKIHLTNGSTIYCLPTGLSGYGIRGFTVDLLIADEAAFIPEAVWTAVTPMLAVTKGDIILLSTPFGKGGYFYRCFQAKDFTAFHISSEDCPRKNQTFLDSERSRMSRLQYAQEYLGEFVDELRQFFPTELIKKCMILSRQSSPDTILTHSSYLPAGDTFLGVDVARMGADETVLASIRRIWDKDLLIQCDMEITERTLLTETVQRIKLANQKWNYKKIYIDDGGMGVGVFDPLLELNETKRKVVAINNSVRSLDNKEKKYKKLLKEDLYNNLLYLMEKGKIQLYDDPEIMLSLKSVQAEYDNGQLKIFGSYTHITEALIRAAWCMKDKSLNIWIR